MPELEREKQPEPQPEPRRRRRANRSGEPSAATRVDRDQTAEPPDTGSGGPGGPPGGNDARPKILTWIVRELSLAAAGAHASRNRVLSWLGLLVAVAVAAVVAGLIADNQVFWTAAASTFSLALAGVVAYAARQLNGFSEQAAQIGRSADIDAGAPAEETGASSREQLRGEIAFELGEEEWHPADLSPEDRRIVERFFRRAAMHRHPEATRRLGQLCADGTADTEEGRNWQQAEECFVKALAWGSVVAAYNLGGLHATRAPLHSADWWLDLVAKHSLPVAAYVAGRVSADKAGVGANCVPNPKSALTEMDLLPRVEEETSII